MPPIKAKYYKSIFISLLLLALFTTNINSDSINLLNNFQLSFNLGYFRTTIFFLFFLVLSFFTFFFLLNKRFKNKDSIVTSVILYLLYLIAHLLVAMIKGQDIDIWHLTSVFYPMFALIILIEGFDSNAAILYFVKKIKWFICLAIIISLISIIFKLNCQFLNLLTLSLLYVSYELFAKRNVWCILPTMLLALLSSYNLSFMFTFIFVAILGILYNLRHMALRKVILLLIATLLFAALATSMVVTKYNFVFHPKKERFTQVELLHATGRKELWKKFIFHYEGTPMEVLIGHGSGYKYNVHYESTGYVVAHLHNIFFDEFYKRGLIGLILLMAIIAISICKRAPAYLKIFFVLLLILGQTELIIFFGVPGIVFWMIAGALNNQSQARQISKMPIGSDSNISGL